MKLNNKTSFRIFLSIILVYVFAIVFVGIIGLVLDSLRKLTFVTPVAIFILIVISIVATFFAFHTDKKVELQIEKSDEKSEWYKGILDSLKLSLQATDNDMNWTFMNKSFEKNMISTGVLKSRETAYGKACSSCNANICNTENCGIKQLHKGAGETFFTFDGRHCKQNTMYLLNSKGEKIGYVEQTADLTPEYSVENYNAKEIKRLVENLNALASGNLNLDLAVGEPDTYTKKYHEDFIDISNSLEKVKNALEMMVSDTNILSKDAVNGILSTRTDGSKHQGIFRDVINGVNSTLDAVVTPLYVAADYVDKISKGNIPPKITDSYNGDFNLIKNNLNTCIDVVDRLVADANMLSASAVEGNLSTRADVDKHHGDYRKIVEGMNNTLDAIATPINETEEILGKFAENDYETSMSENYKGTFKDLSISINDVRSRLLSVEDVFVKVSKGDTSRLEEFKKIGKRSENDRLVPAGTEMMQAICDLTIEANLIANAAVEGNLSIRGNADHFEGGYKEIIEGMNNTMVAIQKPFEEISEVLSYMADGDLTHNMVGNYKGEYEKVKNAMNNTAESISEVLLSIDLTAEQVSTGSNQVSDSSQALSQGATEQASAIEELLASVSEISSQTLSNSTKAIQANKLALLAKGEAVTGNDLMKLMLNAMSKISEASTKIAKVIKVIDDIAFQSNILALNAAVEAARAGQYGKGFAVVAEEVRNLSRRSADAASETTAMIEESIKKAEAGTKLATETANALVKIVEGVENASNLVSEIAVASNEQATGISQISTGIEQVSQVVQTNSATAEQSAAASEELSSQSQLLKRMIGKFSFKNDERPEDLDVISVAKSEKSVYTITAVAKPNIDLKSYRPSKY
jgi:methyl-accepting chemotaxis protein